MERRLVIFVMAALIELGIADRAVAVSSSESAHASNPPRAAGL